MNEYLTYGHAKTRLRYHIIFSTKYRRKCLLDIEQSDYTSLTYAEKNSWFTIVAKAVDLGDHLHLVIEVKPSVSIEQVVRRLKQYTTNQLWKTEPAHLRRFYWHKNYLWTGGYFVSTIGTVSEKVVLDYVRQ
jgi:putative transposase